MYNVKVSRVSLLQKIKANRENHRKVFEEALEGYREQAIEELDKMLAEARAGKQIRREVGLIQPMDKTEDYDRVIAMLEMSVDETIDLDAQSFAQYVLDQWSWMAQSKISNMRYLKSK